MHTPPAQVSLVLQASRSSQGRVLARLTQPVLALHVSLVHGLLSSQVTAPPTQLPTLHRSPWVQALPSSQGAITCLNWQLPVAASQVSAVQALPSSHGLLGPATHRPPLQKSPWVHALPSVHGALVGTTWQPSLASHESAVHGLPSPQAKALPLKHLPPVQASPLVQTEPSASQSVPSFCATRPHLPMPLSHTFLAHALSAPVSQLTTVAGLTLHAHTLVLLSQNSVPLQRLPSSKLPQSASLMHLQVLAPELHLPSWQASPVVHGLPSSHAFKLLLWVQPLKGSQPSDVQGLPSSQSTEALSGMPLHAPVLLQTSPPVQSLPSLQGRLLATWLQPPSGRHESLVHGFLSLQLAPTPAHEPAVQVSASVQSLLSLHGAEFAGQPHLPVTMSHRSSVHGLPSWQVLGLPGAQSPSTHKSPKVQALPSLHTEPASGEWLHPVPGRHLSALQASLSLQSRVVPPAQSPSLHVSFRVHTLPSLQGSWLGACWQPLGEQMSSVHGLPSSQARVCPWQVPLPQ